MRNRTAPLAILLVAVLLASAAPEASARTLDASDPVHVQAVAVGTTADGALRGVSAGVEVWVAAPGFGNVFVDTRPLAETDMQGSARLAAQVAAQTLGLNGREQDHFVVFRSQSPVIGGPSAGAAMALGLAVATWNLHNPDEPWRVDGRTALTGTINPDGTIGPVGGIPEKAQGARDAGMTRFLYPAGQEVAALGGGAPGAPRVEMATFCADIGLDCHAVATLRDVLRLAAGVTLQVAPVPEPGTADYGPLLRSDVRDQVGALEAAREQAATARAGMAPGALRDRVDDLLTDAATRLDEAEGALAAERYYTAATKAFQGRIFAGQAEALAGFPADLEAQQAYVEARLAACQDAAAAVGEDVAGLRATDWNQVHAYGAAQQRSVHASDLAHEAWRWFQDARVVGDWHSSLTVSAFCVERAGTAAWWASLADRFGTGPAVEDVRSHARDAYDRATESVAYARAVVGDAGDGERLLDQARRALSDHPEAALLYAVEAQSAATLALQVRAGTVAPAVVEAARESASQAIAQARAAGVEPLVSVAAFELGVDLEDPAASLGSLWNARGTALLAADSASVDVVSRAPDRWLTPDGATAVVAVFVMGLVTGAGGVLVVASVVWVVRRW